MAISEISAEQGEETNEITTFDVTFKKVRFAGTATIVNTTIIAHPAILYKTPTLKGRHATQKAQSQPASGTPVQINPVQTSTTAALSNMWN